MKLPGPAEWLFSIRTFAAAVTALFIGLAFDLDRPYWAMASAYIASQPLSGATRSKAVYRFLGTLLGATAAVALVPNLVAAPPLLSLGLALWTGLCLYFALLDRTPRSYVFMLAGYTAAIIGFPSVAAPDQIFTTAVARVQEIGLGIGCASLFASVIFPRRVGPVLGMRLDNWLADARSWSLAALAGAPEDEAARRNRRRLAGDLAEIDLLISYLAWDPAAQPEAVRTLRALRRRILMLLPVLSSLADRVQALRRAGPIPDTVQHALDGAAALVRDPSQRTVPDALRRDVDAAEPTVPPWRWVDLVRMSLLERLREGLDLLEDIRRLRAHVDGNGPFPAALAFHRTRGPAEVRLRDHARALWSAGAAMLAVLIVCAFWILSGWADGAVAAEMAAVACCFFAALDDPVPAILRFLTWSGVAVVVDGVYLFAVLPMATNFPMLVLALAPAFLVFGTLTAMPQTNSIGMALSANGATLLSLQSTYNATFDAFVNSGLALMIGMWTAALVTAIVRSVGAEWSAWRLLREGWTDLAEAAEQRGQGDRARFAGLMLDRIGLLAPRIAAAGRGSELESMDLLAELRIGLNIVAIRRARRALPEAVRAQVDAMLDALANYYRTAAGRHSTDRAGLHDRLNRAIDAVAGTGERAPLMGLVGIKRGLFPEAG